ncbi:ATP-binding protein [Modestobacter sp. VKM Ac-2985]|uniref:ATP-binding protein n=1 Tax=Modestobacter sp. VKM Ac-2985 TaxID=3004139 RepID=UPI0022ABC0F6|nr:ATP-binding protein [Modestobacter sp. VKM Ac-2985]MCZ2836886.1 ATP-binding protein [Modestobacter sp. VKM Ac-2985]
MTQRDEEHQTSPHPRVVQQEVQQEVQQQGYRHVGHVLRPGQDLTGVVGHVLREALSAGEPVVVACPEAVANALVEALRGAGDVHVAPTQRIDDRPPTVLAAIAGLVDERAPGVGRRLHLVTGPGGPDADPAVWVQTEALLNHVLAERPVDHVCLLGPTVEGGPDVDAVAAATHPWLLTEHGVVRSPAFRAPDELLREVQRATVPDPLEETEPTLTMVDLDDMRALRRALHEVLADSSLSADAAQDFVLAIDEITANASEHGVPPVDVRLWCTPERLLCAVTDRGTAFDDPLVGYGPAHGDMAVGGMGLWLARRSVDSLTATPADESGDGCTVRLVVNAC